MNFHGETFANFHTAKVPTPITGIELLNESCNIPEDCHCCYGENFYVALARFHHGETGPVSPWWNDIMSQVWVVFSIHQLNEVYLKHGETGLVSTWWNQTDSTYIKNLHDRNFHHNNNGNLHRYYNSHSKAQCWW